MENILNELIAELNALKINNNRRTGDYRIGLTHAIEAIRAKKSVLNLYSVSNNEVAVCPHEWARTADDFDLTCYCKKCGKSSGAN